MSKVIAGILFAAAAGMSSYAVNAAELNPSDGPITINLGFPAGGGMDTMARFLVEPMQEKLGANIIIDYRPGAGGNIASGYVAKAKPNGHTLLIGTASTHGVNDALYKDLPFDVINDFTPIAKIIEAPNVLAVNPEIVEGDVASFVEAARQAPGEYAYASSGFGSSGHLATEDFIRQVDIDLLHVPFKGGPEAVLSLLRGEACCFLTQVQVVKPQLDSGELKPLAVTTKDRLASLPDVPTISETILPDYSNTLWFGLFGPKDMDPEIVESLSSAVEYALSKPEVAERLEALGNNVAYEDAETFKQTVINDHAMWAEIVEAVGVSIE